mmetsp:Transcript_33767/g.58355  ORF Transcript_33767/g.58355 Transcript_33767/m.58355 type:complete len:739 (-) Transcript_33767:611-2827(-)
MMTVKFISCLVVLFVPFAHGFSSVGFSHTSRNNVLAPSTRWQLQSMALRSTIIDAELSEQRGSSTTAPLQPSPTITTNLKGLNSQKKQPAEKETGRKREMVRRVANKLRDRAAAALRLESKLPAKTSGSLFADAATAKKGKEAAAGSAAAMEGGWRRRGASLALVRTAEIWLFALKFALRQAKLKKLEDPAELSAARTSTAEFLKDGLLCLGPTFIKLGQLLSTRIDILPKEYITVLASLQDDVPGFGGEAAVRIIEEDFGKPLSELFDTFDLTPLAAASLGQVHVATAGGRAFAVKVQRQGLKELFDVDLRNLELLARLLDLADPKFDGADRDWVSIYRESAKLLYREIDYRIEAEQGQKFKEDFAKVEWVKVPDVEWDKVSSRVITMEYVPGIKINDLEEIDRRGIDRKLLARRSAESYLTQLCRNGYFHCDPHPGNVACDEQYGGRLIYYDFGMMDEFQSNVRSGLVNLVFAVYENDAKEACDALEEMGILREGVDRVSVEKIARYFLAEFSGTVNSKDGQWVQELDKEQAKEVRRKRRLALGRDLLTVSSDVPFKFPPSFTFVFRAFTSLDGIGKGLDPAYDLTRLAQPYLKELVDLRDGSAAISFLKTWGKKTGLRPTDLMSVVKEPRSVAYLEDTVRRMERGDLQLRVRVVESERAFQRLAVEQKNMFNLVAASGCLNAGLLLQATAAGTPAGQTALAVRAAFLAAAAFGVQMGAGLLQLKKLDKQRATYGV